EVEADRLEDPYRGGGGEYIGGCQNACVLLDHWRGGGVSHRIEVPLYRGPAIVYVYHKKRRRIDGAQRRSGACREIGDILLLQRNVITRAEPCHMPGDQVRPRIRERSGRRLDVPGHVLAEVQAINRHPARVHDVDEHQRVVVREVDETVVRRVVGAVPRQLDTFTTDLQVAVIGKRLVRGRPSGIVVPQQQPTRLRVPDAHDVVPEQRRGGRVVGVMM